jgi:DNA-binding SARP family transcriptional activator/Tfp pilus assembly protein PilF
MPCAGRIRTVLCVWYGVLGPLEVRRGSERVAVGGPQQRALLALLLLEANRVLPIERLIDELWDADPPATARALVHGCVAGLRRALGAGVLLTRAPGYLLRVGPGELDLARADELEQAAAGAAPERASALLGEALALWRGPVLAGIDGRGVTAEATRLEERAVGLLQRRADLDLRLGRYARVAGELRVAVRAHPLREPLWARLVLALYAAGLRSDALASYTEVRGQLVEQLGLDPGEQLRALERDILGGVEAVELLRREAGEPVAAPAPGPAAAVAAPPREVPAQLPAAVRGFVGRPAALAELDALRDGGAGLIAVDGTAGVGKTALALEWAHRVAGQFPDGQLYVDLRGYAGSPPLRPVHALAGFLHALGVQADRVPPDLAEAAAMLRTVLAGRRVLVVLDNARSADQVRPLLPGGAGCLVLVTSRDRLGGLVARDGAACLTLGVLPVAESVDLLAAVLGTARVRAEPAAAAELARRCACLPLALRIAAADLAARPGRRLAAAVDRLGGDRLGALEVAGDDQAAVRAAFASSYAALPDDARRVFRLTGLVAGPDLTPALATALAGAPAAAALDRLARASLLTRSEPDRYGAHDLLRQYAAERAAAEEPDLAAALARLHGWYLGGLAAAAELLYPQMVRLLDGPARLAVPLADPAAAMAWLDAEWPSLVAAAEQAAASGDPAMAVRIADGVRGYLWLRPRGAAWQALAELARAAAAASGDLCGQAVAELSAADAYLLQARYRPATAHYRRAADLAGQTGWLAVQAAALGNLGMVDRQTGALPQAVEHFGAALEIDRHTGAVGGQASRLANLANVSLELGDLDGAVAQLEEALDLFRRIGAVMGEVSVLANLGLVHIHRGEPDTAHTYASRSLALLRRAGHPNDDPDVLTILAMAYRDQGRLAKARTTIRTALDLADQTGDRRFEHDGRNTLASIHLRQDDPEAAVAEYDRALALARSVNAGAAGAAAHAEVTALIGLAESYTALGRDRDARHHAQQAATRARQAGYRALEDRARTLLAAEDLPMSS